MTTFYDNKRYFGILSNKPIFAQWFIQLNIASWLSTETILSVNFTAKTMPDEQDVTDTVLDVVKCTYSGSVLKPFINAGVENVSYRIIIKVVTVEESQEEFYIDFTVKSG